MLDVAAIHIEVDGSADAGDTSVIGELPEGPFVACGFRVTVTRCNEFEGFGAAAKQWFFASNSRRKT